MTVDYEIAACSRRCAASDRPISAGSDYFAVLIPVDGDFVRLDFLPEAWTGPPPDALAWWQAKAPAANDAPKLAPQDVLINLFVELAGDESQRAFRYVLGLLMLRRRIVRVLETHCRADGSEIMIVECVRREEQYELPVVHPDAAQAEQIEQRIFELLYTSSEQPEVVGREAEERSTG